jgi:tricorn protease
VAESRYLRYPHVACDLITFTAEDDVWLASLSEAADGRGTRARPLTADQAPVLHPRLNPSATHVAWTSTRDGTRSLGHPRAGEQHRAPREAYAVPVDGGPVRRLTYWGDRFATVRGWVSDNEVLVLSGTGQHAVEIPAGQRGPVISRYREVAGRMVDSFFTKLPDARDHPVFQIDSVNPVG